MEEKEGIVKIPFSSGDKFTDLWTWLDNINALGQIIQLIVRHDVSYVDEMEFIGGMVQDYSSLIKETLDDKALEDYFEQKEAACQK